MGYKMCMHWECKTGAVSDVFYLTLGYALRPHICQQTSSTLGHLGYNLSWILIYFFPLL